MTPPQSPDTVKVIQEDIAAAKTFWERDWHDSKGMWGRLDRDSQDALTQAFARHRIDSITRLSSSPSGIGADLLDEDGLVLLMLYALHEHVPEDQRPMSMSDLSDEQAERARTAVRLLAKALPKSSESARSQSRMGEGEAERAWLIEHRVQPPQWSIVRDPTGIGAFYSDVHRAHRFPSKEAASEAMRRMCITPEERGQYFVSEHVWVDGTSVAAPYFGMDEQEFEDFLADAIDDSMDMDWTGRIGARSVIRALSALTPKEQ